MKIFVGMKILYLFVMKAHCGWFSDCFSCFSASEDNNSREMVYYGSNDTWSPTNNSAIITVLGRFSVQECEDNPKDSFDWNEASFKSTDNSSPNSASS